MRVEDELRAMGSDLDPNEFGDALADLFMQEYPAYTVEDLICRKKDIDRFCKLAFYKLRLPDEADELIRRTLLNRRRKGELSLRERATAGH